MAQTPKQINSQQHQDSTAIQMALDELRRDLDKFTEETRRSLEALNTRMDELARSLTDHSWHSPFEARLYDAERQLAELRTALLGDLRTPEKPGLIPTLIDLKRSVEQSNSTTRQIVTSVVTSILTAVLVAAVMSLLK